MELQGQYETLQAEGIEVLSVSTDDESSAGLADRLGFDYPILFNPDHDVIEQYGVYDLHGDGFAAHSIFIVDRDGVLRWKYISGSTYDVPSTARVVEQARAV